MDENREQRLRARPHAIWEREGRPEGRETAHWSQAEQEMRAEEEAEAPGVAPTAGASGISSRLQPGGSSPSGGPGDSVGSIGTGGGSTAGGSRAAHRAKKRTDLIDGGIAGHLNGRGAFRQAGSDWHADLQVLTLGFMRFAGRRGHGGGVGPSFFRGAALPTTS